MPTSEVSSDGMQEMFRQLANPETSAVDKSRGSNIRAPAALPKDHSDESSDENDSGDNDEDDEDRDEGNDNDSNHASEDERGPPPKKPPAYAEADMDSVVSAAPYAPPAAPPAAAFSQYMQRMPTVQRSRHETEAASIEKSNMLADLERLQQQGIHLSREWTMQDNADDMAFELKRLMIQVDEANNIGMMQNGLQLACTGIEMMSKRYKILDLDGWSAEVCRDMSKYNNGLGRLYRKYWRRSHTSSPESDILLSLVGSMGMFHMRRTLSKKVFGGGGKSASNPMGGLFGARGASSGTRNARHTPPSKPSAPSSEDSSDSDDDAEGLPPRS